MFSILSYGLNTSAGKCTDDAWKQLFSSQVSRRKLSYSHQLSFQAEACVWDDNETRMKDRSLYLAEKLFEAWEECEQKLPEREKSRLHGSEYQVGVILASTKGAIDEFVWSGKTALEFCPFETVLEKTLEKLPFSVRETSVVSTACTSSINALYMARTWLESAFVDRVLVASVDCTGPFVLEGFQSLKALSPTQARPFSQNRDGLQLGDSANILYLGKEHSEAIALIRALYIESDGNSLTRPAKEGLSLKRCIEECLNEQTPPSHVLAHGTGTHYNDLIEDSCLSHFFSQESQPQITNSKWSIGHCLGASAGVDICLSSHMIQHQKCFTIAHQGPPDPELQLRYGYSLKKETPVNNILITSLGFGGSQAAALISKP